MENEDIFLKLEKENRNLRAKNYIIEKENEIIKNNFCRIMKDEQYIKILNSKSYRFARFSLNIGNKTIYWTKKICYLPIRVLRKIKRTILRK